KVVLPESKSIELQQTPKYSDVVQEIPTKLDKVVLPESKSIELQQTPKYSDVVQEIPTKLDKVVLPESKSIELQQTPQHSDENHSSTISQTFTEVSPSLNIAEINFPRTHEKSSSLNILGIPLLIISIMLSLSIDLKKN
ncbi:hypothetical protein, partial [Carnobacterium maltaromaticum]|uniref:hypothetical protein n=1 Tax=Carnobacterium maltaromaticum TaxID=2751 RepID=UPI0011036079